MKIFSQTPDSENRPLAMRRILLYDKKNPPQGKNPLRLRGAAMKKRIQKNKPGWDWRGAVTPAVRWAFLCCFAAGFFAHLFAFTNIIPNSDGISRVSDPQQMTVSGRWFLHYATMWNGYIQAPAVIGFFSLLFLSLSAATVMRDSDRVSLCSSMNMI